MKRFFTSVCLFAASSLIFPSLARHYYFRHYMIEDGLPINTVYSATSDHLGYMWFGTRDGLCRYDGTSFERVTDENGYANGMVSILCEDRNGVLWFSTLTSIINYDLQTNRFEKIYSNDAIRISDIQDDGDGSVWFTTQDTLFRYSPSDRNLERFSGHFLYADADKRGQVWFTTREGKIVRYDSGTRQFTGNRFEAVHSHNHTDIYPQHIDVIDDTYLLISTNNSDIYRFNMHTGQSFLLFSLEETVNCIQACTPNEFWVGTYAGIYIYDVRSGELTLADDKNESGLTNNNVTCISCDKEGNVWLGTYYGGLNFCGARRNAIDRVFHTGTGTNDFSGKVVHAFATDEDGILWVGNEDGHLNRMDFRDRSLTEISMPQRMNIHALISEGDKLWVLAFESGLYLYDKTTGKWSRREDSPAGNCLSMIRLIDGSILIGTSSGLHRYDRLTDAISKVPHSDFFVHTLYQDSRGTIWVGAFGNGLYFSKDNLQTLVSVRDVPGVEMPPKGYINHITEDSHNHLWVCTQGEGLCWTSLDSPLRFQRITAEQGLPSDIACALVDDNGEKQLWVSTTNGLATVNPASLTVTKAFLDNGKLNGNQYTNGSCCKLPDGRICFGTTNGLISFHPASIQDPIADAPLYFRRIYAEGDRGNSLVTEEGKSITMTHEITIRKRDAAHLSITFPAVYFSYMSTPKYEYSLSKNGKVFTHNITDNPTLALTALPAGRYLLDVQLMNSNNPQARQQLAIKIVPPWYTSPLAIAAYCLIALSVIATLIFSLAHRRKIRAKYEEEQMESFRQKELYDAKVNFFSNITHEIRTPLSLIKLPVDKIIANHEYTAKSKEDIETIKANTDRLLELTNQLLDIRKMERGEIVLQYVQRDICQIVRKTCDYFTAALQERHIQIAMNLPQEPIMMKCAPDIVQKIVSNLMSNAVKFCHSAIKVELCPSADGQWMVFKVFSDGDMIKGKDRENIFTPFFQVETTVGQLKGVSGTGLGLPYSRTLASLHNGTLALDDTVTDGNCFVLSLPMVISEKASSVDTEEESSEETDSSKRTLLIVEDDEPMRRYLCKELSAFYNVFPADNGENAVKVLNEHRIDLVVSDVMMPVMDGFELCSYIKNNNAFSHIPVLLLTAAVGVETHINTLESGADGFIEKPFDYNLLLANIDNLFKNREIANRQFAESPLAHYSSTSLNKVENAFMEKLHSVIQEHISDTELDTTLLCDILGTSKATLYRKIKANSGMNTNEYIRLCRLKKAADMLASGSYRINEVAYLTGFTSPSYFATSFQKQFNISPSTFLKRVRGQVPDPQNKCHNPN